MSYEEKDKEDLPYWYLERTNIGHLSLAVRKIKGFPLQEFSIKKGRGTQKSTGRADLYMHFPKGTLAAKHEFDFNVEAKQIWCSLSIGVDQRDMIDKALQEADADLRKLNEKSFRAQYGMALLFILPYKRILYEEEGMKKHFLSTFKKQIKQTTEDIGASFVAIHYTDIQISTDLCLQHTKPEWCPGIAVVGKISNLE